MLWAVHALHADTLVWNDAVLDRLAATPRLKQMIVAGATPSQIFAAWAPELAHFHTRADRYRLYP
jgi:aminoglycoside phosphotransferase family enzyme